METIHFICPHCAYPCMAFMPEENERQHLCVKCGCWTTLRKKGDWQVLMTIHPLPLPPEKRAG